METLERIIGVAVRDPAGRVWSRPGAIHADLPAGTAGWMTSSGRFVTRAEAERIIDAVWRSARRASRASDPLFLE
jgi:hypothetical protein